MPAHPNLHEPGGRSRATDLAFLLLALSLALIFLQWVLRMAHHGVDLTDEGFSFNSISHPWLYTTTLTQFGFVYHPLYEALGQDLIRLRQAGMLISYALAMTVAALYLFRVQAGQTGWRLLHALPMAAILSVSALLNLILTDDWISTPSYNSLTFQAFLVTVVGTQCVLLRSKTGWLLGWLLIGVGGWLCFMGKASSAAALGVLVLAYLYAEKSITVKALCLSLGTVAVLLVATAWVLDGSMIGLIERFRSGFGDMNSLLLERRKPLLRVDEVWWSPQLKWGLSAMALWMALSTYGLMAGNRFVQWLLAGVNLVLLAVAAGVALDLFQVPIRYFRFHGLVFAIIPLGIAVGRIAFGLRMSNHATLRQQLPGMLFFLCLPYAYAFGSGNNLWMTAIGAAFFWAMAGVALLVPLQTKQPWMRLSAVAAATLLVGSISLKISMQHPYRQIVPLNKSTYPVLYSEHNRPILVGESLAKYLNDLRTQARAAGFTEGLPMLDLSGHLPGVLHFLEAKPIAMPWLLGGYPGSMGFARRALDRTPCMDILNAWVIVEINGPRQINPSIILHRYGLDMEKDYIEVGQAGLVHPYGKAAKKTLMTVLLKPKMLTTQDDHRCVTASASSAP